LVELRLAEEDVAELDQVRVERLELCGEEEYLAQGLGPLFLLQELRSHAEHAGPELVERALHERAGVALLPARVGPAEQLIEPLLRETPEKVREPFDEVAFRDQEIHGKLDAELADDLVDLGPDAAAVRDDLVTILTHQEGSRNGDDEPVQRLTRAV